MRSESLTIAVLTGQRPEMVAATLASFVENQPEAWAAATRVVLHNSGDRETGEVLDRFSWHERRTLDGQLRGIGAATNHLLQMIGEADSTYVLRLEDDWHANDTPFLADSIRLLDSPHVRQVRLRKISEPVLKFHQITKQPIRWNEQDSGHFLSRSAHFTYNPSLMRTWDAVALGGSENETAAQRKYVAAGWGSAQHSPGVFSHLGDHRAGLSLRLSGGRE